MNVGRLAALFCVFSASLVSFSQTPPTTIDATYRSAVDGKLLSYSIPSKYASATFTTTTLPNGNRRLSLTFPSALGTESGYLLIQAFFDSDSTTDTKYDTCLAVPVGAYTYNSTPAIAPGGAGIVRQSDHVFLGGATSTTSGSVLSVDYNPALVANKAPNRIMLRYLPLSLPPSSVVGGLAGTTEVTIHLDNDLRGAHAKPDLPSDSPAGGSSSPFGFGLSSLNNNSLNEEGSQDEDTEDEEEEAEEQNPTTPAQPVLVPTLPPRQPGIPTGSTPVPPGEKRLGGNEHPKGWGTGKGDGAVYQPIPNPPPTGTVVVDLDGNGVNDYILPGSDWIPYTNDIAVTVNMNNGALVTLICRDINGDGKISKDEIMGIAHECIQPHGINTLTVIIKNGKVILEGSNQENGSGARGNLIIYEYDPATGRITAIKYNPQGKPLKWDPVAKEWVPHPNQNPAAEPVGFEGPSKDFPWGPGGRAIPVRVPNTSTTPTGGG